MQQKIACRTIIVVAGAVLFFFITFADVVSAQVVLGTFIYNAEKSAYAYIRPSGEKVFLGSKKHLPQSLGKISVKSRKAIIRKIPFGKIIFSIEKDSDNDGLSDTYEDFIGTKKNARDSDMDGINDRIEMMNGFDPLKKRKKLIAVQTSRYKGQAFTTSKSKGFMYYNPMDKRFYVFPNTSTFARYIIQNAIVEPSKLSQAKPLQVSKKPSSPLLFPQTSLPGSQNTFSSSVSSLPTRQPLFSSLPEPSPPQPSSSASSAQSVPQSSPSPSPLPQISFQASQPIYSPPSSSAPSFNPSSSQTVLPPSPPSPQPQPEPVGAFSVSKNDTENIALSPGVNNIRLASFLLTANNIEEIEIQSIVFSHAQWRDTGSVINNFSLTYNGVSILAQQQNDKLIFQTNPSAAFVLAKNTAATINLTAAIQTEIPARFHEKLLALQGSFLLEEIKGAGKSSKQSITLQPNAILSKYSFSKVVNEESISCSTTTEEFKKSGKMQCGHIAWELTPESAQVFIGDPRPYLMKYESLYQFYKDFMGGYEPSQKKITISENTQNKYPADANWVDSVIRISTPFAREQIAYLANHDEQPLAPSFMHELGHIFSLGPNTRNAYIWKDMTEAYANISGIIPYLMVYDGSFKMATDFWCRAKLKAEWPCDGYFTNFEDYPEWVGSKTDYQEYMARNETFRSLFIEPRQDENLYKRGGKFQVLLTNLYSEYKQNGRGKEFYDALKKTQQFYIQQSSALPAKWISQDSGYDSPSDTVLKANVFLFLLSSFMRADLLARFENEWRYPILEKTKTAFSDTRAKGFSDADIKSAVISITAQESVQGRGLLGLYFGNMNLSGDYLVSRIDPRIDFDWEYTSPLSPVPADNFSVRWSGYVVPRYSETYTFTTTADDGVRLWINNRLIIDDWTVHSPLVKNGTIFLEAGRQYSITLEYFDEWWGAVVRLGWSSKSQIDEIIPQSALFPPAE